MREQDILNQKVIYILIGGRVRAEMERLEKDEENGDWYAYRYDGEEFELYDAIGNERVVEMIREGKVLLECPQNS